MSNGANRPVPRVELEPGYSIARVIRGGWQLTPDHARRALDRPAIVDGLIRLAEAGFTTFDCADIYTGVEELFGEFLNAWHAGGRDPDSIQIHTKYVPDIDSLATLSNADITRSIDRSLRRLGVARLDLVQFHWWDHQVPGFVEAAQHLGALETAGKIRCLGLTNVGTGKARQLHEAGISIAAHQVQYSLLDQRPENGLAETCRESGAQLLCYGALAGGFLTDRWAGAAAPPEPLANRSLTKYRLIIREAGGWNRFQGLLATAREIAAKHEVSLANVAARWVLDREQVAAIVLGVSGAKGVGSARGADSATRLAENLRLFTLELDTKDRQALDAHIRAQPGPSGDIYELERDRSGPHWAILRTGLNAGPEPPPEPPPQPPPQSENA